jgi:putative transposase
VTAELHRRGMVVNHKRVLRVMRTDNLAARMTLTCANQLWVADITYIRLRTEFVYLAVVIES